MFLQNNEYEVLTENGFKDFDGIKITKRDEYLELNINDQILECTSEHKIKIEDEFQEASKQKKYKKRVQYKKDKKFYDLINVAKGNHYITNNITSHNCAFVAKNKAEQFLASVYPTITVSRESKIIMSSTPFGYNHFAKFWFDAKEGNNEFKHFEVHWSQVPGRDEEWAKETKRNVGEKMWRQEYECKFLGSQNTLINANVLENLYHIQPIEYKMNNSLKIYRHFEKNHTYALVVDTSEGKSLDYHAAHVLDITQQPYTQVAVYRNNTLSYLLLPTVLDNIIKMYLPNVIIGIENNNIGDTVINDLHYNLETEAFIFNANDRDLGSRMTTKTKRIGTSTLKSLIEEQKLLITDFDTIDELYNFVEKGSSYKADANSTDDLVMALVTFGYMITTQFFKDYALGGETLREKLYKEQLKQIEEQVSVAPIIMNNTDNIDQKSLFSDF